MEHQSHRWPLSPSHTVRTNPRNVTSRLCSCVLPSSTRAYVAARQRGRTKTYEKPTIAGTTSENERQEGERGAPSDGERRPKTHTHTHTHTRTRINTRGARTRTDGRTDGWTVTERRGRGKKREREERETRAEADLSRFRRESNYFFFFFFIHPSTSIARTDINVWRMIRDRGKVSRLFLPCAVLTCDFPPVLLPPSLSPSPSLSLSSSHVARDSKAHPSSAAFSRAAFPRFARPTRKESRGEADALDRVGMRNPWKIRK